MLLTYLVASIYFFIPFLACPSACRESLRDRLLVLACMILRTLYMQTKSSAQSNIQMTNDVLHWFLQMNAKIFFRISNKIFLRQPYIFIYFSIFRNYIINTISGNGKEKFIYKCTQAMSIAACKREW